MAPILSATEFDEQFVQGMRDRVAVSFHKYGPVANAVANKADFLKALEGRIAKYRETGNTEWLIDAANYAMFEFMYPSHRQAHFRSTDSDESPGKAPERKRDRSVTAVLAERERCAKILDPLDSIVAEKIRRG